MPPDQLTVSNRAIWAIAAPMILSNLSVPLLGLVDTAVMGHMDAPAYLAAVAVGATIFSLLFMSFNFLRMGTTGLAAQRFGSEDGTGMRTVLGQALLIAAAMSAFLVSLKTPIAIFALNVIGPEPEVRSFALAYFQVRIWGAFPTLCNFVIVGWLLGTQNARGPLAIMLSINVTNMLLDVSFVIGLGMGVKGVAAASVLGELCGLGVGLWLVSRTLGHLSGKWDSGLILRWAGFSTLATINTNLFVRTLSLMFTFTFITAWGARLGATTLAVNAVLMNFQNILSYGLDGIAHAAEALVGRAIGERRTDAIRAAVNGTLRWSGLFGVAFAIAYALAGPTIINLLTGLPEVRALALQFLPWMVLSPLVSLWSFAYDGIFIGATRAKEMRNAMLVSVLLVFLPCAFFFQDLGNHGLWLAFICFMLSRAITMAWSWRRIAGPEYRRVMQ